MNKPTRYASLLLAGLLNLAPLATRILQTASPALNNSPFAIVMTWLVRAVAVGGAVHAVSAGSAALVSATTIAGTNGIRVSYQIKINDGVARQPLSWRIGGTLYGTSGSTTNQMPPGTSLALGTGIISGTPTNSGTFKPTITAYENPGGGGASLTFTLTFNISATHTATLISLHPASTNLHLGETVTLAVAATGTAPLTYQWKKDTVNIPGATASTYTVNATNSSVAGSYTVTVTGGGGAVTSNGAAITVTPLSLQILSHTDTATTFSFQTAATRSYLLQRTSSPTPPVTWSSAGTFSATGAVTTFTDSTAAGSPVFWRYRPSP